MAEQIIQLAKNVLKRVVCLYRVSTVGQVEKDDIPMQKQFCREFVQRQPGWEIVKEFSEKGVSGFKVSAKKRDAVQEIQRMALQGEFDILLVFMFDRLGRKDDETPFVVEWFVKNGIEVWSAMEGQQRFDTTKCAVTVSGRWRVRMETSLLGMCFCSTGRSNRWHG